MEFLNISINLLRRQEYVGAEPVQRATWITVMAWCAHVENSGRIADCRTWKDRQWQQTCGVTLAEISETCALWTWDGDDLVMWEYPVDQEQVLHQKRAVARENGRSGGRPPKTKEEPPPEPTPETDPKPTSVSTSVPISEPTSKPISETVREWKGKKGNEKEGGEERASAPPPPPLDFLPGLVQDGLADMWPDAPDAFDGAERQALGSCLGILGELTHDDWEALAAWVKASNRSRNQKTLWPRDRGEFLRHASEVIAKVRPWWRKQRPPAPPLQVVPDPPADPPEPIDGELAELRAILGMKPKS